MNYAIVENGIVVNIIVADAAFAEKIGAKPVYDGCAIGEAYNPPVEPPEPTEAEILADHETRLTELSDELSAVEDAICELDEAAAAWRAGIEDALCELDEGGDL